MRSNLLYIIIFLCTCFLFNTSANAQVSDEVKKQKMAEKKFKLKKAKERAAQNVIVLGYHGGTMAPWGVNLYTMNPKKAGFYASFRVAASEESRQGHRPYKGLNLNAGFTQNITFPIGIYAAAGISDYTDYTPKAYVSPYSPEMTHDSHWQFGFDTSFGLIFHLRGIELQTGISLFNLSKPEFCFGIGLNGIRKK